MQKTAAQIADEVLEKTAYTLLELGLTSAGGALGAPIGSHIGSKLSPDDTIKGRTIGGALGGAAGAITPLGAAVGVDELSRIIGSRGKTFKRPSAGVSRGVLAVLGAIGAIGGAGGAAGSYLGAKAGAPLTGAALGAGIAPTAAAAGIAPFV